MPTVPGNDSAADVIATVIKTPLAMIGRRCREPRLAPTLNDPSGIDGRLVQDE
jgi:hypothetical protein